MVVSVHSFKALNSSQGDPEKKHGFIATFTKGSARLNIMLASSAKSAVYAVSEVSKGEGAAQHL